MKLTKLDIIDIGDTFVAIEDCFFSIPFRNYYMSIDKYPSNEFYAFRFQKIYRARTLLTEKKYHENLHKYSYALNVFKKHI